MIIFNEIPTVSVIIPNYNHGPFLSRRIASVLDQSYQDFEIILLDDCSTDNSREVIEKYRGHPKVKHIVYNEVNGGGPFGQWAKGVSFSKGKYIWIAESDDWCENHLLERLMKPLEADAECVVSYCQSYCIETNGVIRWQSSHDKLEEIVDGKDFIKKKMLLGNTIFNASMVVWRRQVYFKIAHDFTEYKFAGDRLFWVRLAQKGKVAINGRLMNYFLKHKGDVSGDAMKHGIGCFEDIKILNVMYKEQVINDKEYFIGYKKVFKTYWVLKKEINEALRTEIDVLLLNPLDGKKSYYKALSSVIWKNLTIGYYFRTNN